MSYYTDCTYLIIATRIIQYILSGVKKEYQTEYLPEYLPYSYRLNNTTRLKTQKDHGKTRGPILCIKRSSETEPAESMPERST